MSHLISREEWPDDVVVGAIAYFCGVLADEPEDSQARADARARRAALEYLRHHVGPVWKAAVNRDGALRWELLVAAAGAGEERFDAQHWRANFQPSERYVTTHAGTVRYRLRADESGYDNLFLAGDWTRNGINGGSVEAAITSGMQAARAICGSPAKISGESGWLADD